MRLITFIRILSGLAIFTIFTADLAKSLDIGIELISVVEKSAGGDRALHFSFAMVLCCGLTALATMWFNYQKACNMSLLLLIGLLVAAEYFQLLLPTRKFQIEDLIAGLCGLIVSWLMLQLVYKLYVEHTYDA